jgi:hypothetical protein
MEVGALAIPSAQTVNGEGVTQVIRAWPDSTFFGLQTGSLEQNTESASRGLNRQPALVHANEEACVPIGCRIRQASANISIKLSGQRGMKRDPSGPSFEGIYIENGGLSVHVSHSQAKRFSKTNSGTVQDQNQRPV